MGIGYPLNGEVRAVLRKLGIIVLLAAVSESVLDFIYQYSESSSLLLHAKVRPRVMRRWRCLRCSFWELHSKTERMIPSGRYQGTLPERAMLRKVMLRKVILRKAMLRKAMPKG